MGQPERVGPVAARVIWGQVALVQALNGEPPEIPPPPLPYLGCEGRHRGNCRLGYVYAIDFRRDADWKIGRTMSWRARSEQHRPCYGQEAVDYAIVVPVDCVVDAERHVHRELARFRISLSEWFRCSRRDVITALERVRGPE